MRSSKMARESIQMEVIVRLLVVVEKEANWHIAYSPHLEVASQGKTEKKAIENVQEAIALFFTSCFERGVLDQVLKEAGFRPLKKGERKKRLKAPKGKDVTSIDVPLPFQFPSPPEYHPLWHA